MNPDVSPDGRHIVLDLLGDLYLVATGGGEAQPLTTGAAVDYRPRFSPDGRRIAFVSDRSGTDNLWVMNADGTNARLVSRQDPFERPKGTRFFITPTWTPDGTAVVAAVTSELTFYGAEDIRRFLVDGDGSSTSLTLPPRLKAADRAVYTAKRAPFPREGVDPDFSPDGRTLFYSLRTDLVRFNDEKLMPQYQVGQLDLHTGQLHVITSAAQGAFTPRISPDGRWLVYAVRHDAETGLRVRDLENGSDRWLVFPVDRDGVENWWTETLVNAYSFLPDSASLVTSFGGRLWRVKVPEGTTSPIPFTAKVSAKLAALSPPQASIEGSSNVSVRYSRNHVLSPDGRHLAFEALGRIWIKRWPDGAPIRLTAETVGLDEEAHPTWAPDGRSVIFAGFTLGTRHGHLYEVQTGGRHTPAALTRQPGYYMKPSVTPDGKMLVAWKATVSSDALYDGFSQAQLVTLARRGGPVTTLLPVSFDGEAPDLLFTRLIPERVFYVDGPSSTLVSLGLDTGTYRRHLLIRGLGLASVGTNSRMRVTRALLDPQGGSLIVQHNATFFGQIDRIDLARIPLGSATEPPELPATGPEGALRDAVRRLTTVEGGIEPFWGHEPGAVHFTIGDAIYRVSGKAEEMQEGPSQVASLGLVLPAPKVDGALALRGALILTMHDGDLARGDIVTEGSRIKAIGPYGTIDIPPGAHVIDASGLTIMPGLVSTHSHQFEVGRLTPLAASRWPLHAKLAYGVTTLLDPAPPVRLFALADGIAAGQTPGPRILQTGARVSWNDAFSSPGDAQRIADRGRRYRDCCMKIYDAGGRIERQWLFAAVRSAGLSVIPESEGSLNASLSLVLDGVSQLPHGIAMPVYDDLLQLFGRSGTSMSYQFNTLVGNGGPSTSFYFYNHELDESDPLMRAWVPYRYLQLNNRRRVNVPDVEYVFRMYGEYLARLMDAGMPIHVGEHGILHGLANHWAIWALANGAGNRRALEAATIHGARGLGIERDVGSLAPGKLADMLVIEGNPLDDIRKTRQVRYVVKNGELYHPGTLARIAPTGAAGPSKWWTDDLPRVRSEAVPASGIAPW